MKPVHFAHLASATVARATYIIIIIYNNYYKFLFMQIRDGANNAILICGLFVGSEVTCWQRVTHYSPFSQAYIHARLKRVSLYYSELSKHTVKCYMLQYPFDACEHVILGIKITWHIVWRKHFYNYFWFCLKYCFRRNIIVLCKYVPAAHYWLTIIPAELLLRRYRNILKRIPNQIYVWEIFILIKIKCMF